MNRENPLAWIEENKEVSLDKLLRFWDWTLENIETVEVFEAFGLWINPKQTVISNKDLIGRVKHTLEKSGGKIDWEYGLMEALPTFAEVSPVDTVSILRSYFTEMDTSIQARGFMHIDDDLVQVFRVLYSNPATKESTYSLINDLLPVGGGVYWRLKDAMN